jgi:hypothetical protein
VAQRRFGKAAGYEGGSMMNVPGIEFGDEDMGGKILALEIRNFNL